MGSKALTEEKGHRVKQWLDQLFVVVLCLLAAAMYFHFFVNTALVEVELQVDRKSDFKIYWETPLHHYSEKFVATVHTIPEKTSYSMWLTSLRGVSTLRIDTHSYQGEVKIRKISIKQEGFEPIVLEKPEDFEDLTVYGQVEESAADASGLTIWSSGKDPNFLYTPKIKATRLFTGWLALRLLFVVGVAYIVIISVRRWMNQYRLVVVLFAGAGLLVLVMAGISAYNVHPDEYVHMAATEFYESHWLPPVLDDPDIRDTYSVYGASRLNNGEIYYLFAGKFYKFMKPFKVSENFALRAFNLFLFGLIFLYAAKSTVARMVAIPFLLSAQVWYVFSYCASDAFALFIAFVAACLVVDPESLFNKYLKGEGKLPPFVALLGIGLLFGILLLLKKNYYPFIGLLGIAIVIKLFWSEEFYWERRTAILRLIAIGLIGVSVAGLRMSADYIVNGFDKKEKIAQLREELADPLYKPSTPLEDKHIYLYRRARGATLEQIIKVDRWFEHTFRSAFGVFGYFTISAPDKYYSLVRWTGVGLLAFLIASIYWRGGWSGAILATMTLGLGAALLGVSLYHSWTADFQPQGRYLFPFVPMLGLLYAWSHRAVNSKILMLGVVPMYFLAVYSFIFEGLLRIPKV